jgi:carboxymethylenebutenolidase
MCFPSDSVPPIDPISGAEVRHRDLVLGFEDGNRFLAFEAFSDQAGAAVIVLPDVRGIFDFYRQLAVRFAEAGHDAVTIDYFGRTAGIGGRDERFPHMDHVAQTTLEGIRSDVAAAIAHVRAQQPARPVFTVGFCFGGSNSWHQAASGHGLAGAVGFYGNPRGNRPPGSVPLIERVAEIECPILGLMGGNDPGIPLEVVTEFDEALTAAGVVHELITYPDAPHSFFDHRYQDFAAESDDAWKRVLAFIASNAPEMG